MNSLKSRSSLIFPRAVLGTQLLDHGHPVCSRDLEPIRTVVVTIMQSSLRHDPCDPRHVTMRPGQGRRRPLGRESGIVASSPDRGALPGLRGESSAT